VPRSPRVPERGAENKVGFPPFRAGLCSAVSLGSYTPGWLDFQVARVPLKITATRARMIIRNLAVYRVGA
jgi:hypothetical protein